MIDYSNIYSHIQETDLSPWLDTLQPKVKAAFASKRWGDLPNWLKVLEELPAVEECSSNLNTDYVSVDHNGGLPAETINQIESQLMKLHPWRKGPFKVFDIAIETEWRSDAKWDRLVNHIESLKDRSVLDVGCGNGYHCLRMLGEEAKLAIGIDPTLLYVVQFYALQHFLKKEAAAIFPIGIDDMPESLDAFDTVFSMGLLYHRRSPLDHLLSLRNFLREDGQLVLETIVIDGEKGQTLTPQGRYAKMPNVWIIPSILTVESWLCKMGFDKIKCVDVTTTTSDEQRVTPWMGFQSLDDFLDPSDKKKTIEGYPAPKRAIFVANKKSS